MSVALADKYTQREGRVFISGVQALVRLPLLQRERDSAAGLDTAGYVTGYRGSPLGGVDHALWDAHKLLEAAQIHFAPAINEDLAATAVWGTQQGQALPGAKHDGVFALWYGKGPGVDRSGDAIRHGNLAGTAAHGGVLLVFGDDHAGKSSTVAHQSEQALAAHSLPLLYPATVQEVIDFGLLGWALSRHCSLWVGLKLVNETAENTASVDVDVSRRRPAVPAAEGSVNLEAASLHVIAPGPAEQHLVRRRLPRVHAFVQANAIDRVVFGAPGRRLGLVAAGKAYLDVRQALQRLGLSAERAAALGLGLYKPGLVWPLEPQGLKAFALGCEELMVIEEKRAFIEDQAARVLYGQAGAPRLSGKCTPQGEALLPAHGVLDVMTVARAIGQRMRACGMADAALLHELDAIEPRSSEPIAIAPAAVPRTPYFCSGCPHNRSTVVPAGALGLGGIGCHGMAVYMDRALTPTHMGGEGLNWVGMAPFTQTRHVFQNLGDGTYAHSGLLAIHAAVVSGANITYKILFNDAVAMTGGQPVEGPLTVPAVAQQVAALGATAVRVVSDEPDKYARQPGGLAAFASGTTVHHRDQLEAVQRELAATPGTTVLIYDQTCAAEKRRRRKRGQLPDPPVRAFINAAVCEGCGDCSVQANCVSIEPLETELGRKRRIDQHSCNKDMSCIDGFCPSFVTVHGGRLRQPVATPLDEARLQALPQPVLPQPADNFNVLIAGVGGSGVVTVGALLGMAAHLEGKGASVYDMTGLSQKGGAVFSHLKIAAQPHDVHAVAVGPGQADLLLGCDLLVAASADALRSVQRGRSRVVLNTRLVPTGAFQRRPGIDFQHGRSIQCVADAAGPDAVHALDAAALALAFTGDALAANLIIVGAAWQLGALPLQLASIEAAIRLNGVAVATGLRALAIGRLHAHDAAGLEALLGAPSAAAPPFVLHEFVARRVLDLTAYQNAALAQRYEQRMQAVVAAEQRVAPGRGALAEAVARAYFKLLAYKDEYEVARLFTDGRFEQALREQFEGDFTLNFHLAPPLLSQRDPITGRPAKRRFGPSTFRLFKLLARGRFLRGTPFDPFGHSTERRAERAAIHAYESMLDELLVGLDAGRYDAAVARAARPLEVKGYGPVKEAHHARALAQAA